MMSGSLDVADYPVGGSFTSSSLTLTTPSLITSETGIFSSLVPNLSDLISDTGTLTGLSDTPTTENINNFLVFSTPSSLEGQGTTPNNRFEFDLSTLSEIAYTGNPETAAFYGTGTLVDTSGIYASSPADFTVSFSGEGNYSMILAVTAIPEPARYGICAGILAFLPVLFGLLRHRLSGRKS
jgi:hypothetical protein